ncbi:MAG: hypothetical protein H6718_23120 [Polyangiaceae bacterium]|nr:hypothetical protein [Polyangiaceae bacterium]
MRIHFLALVLTAVAIGCGETSGDGNGSVSAGGTSGSGGSSGSAGSGGTSGNGGNGGTSASGGTGNTGSGASSGSGGTTGGSGGGSTAAECVSAGDCKLFSDCCSCLGVPNGENPGGCDLVCDVDECSRQGIKEPQCIAGRCVAGYECDGRKALCATPSPVCGPGEVAEIEGGCWSGDCVPAIECVGVTSCADCVGENVACATYDTQLGPEYHCVEIPDGCNGFATCECLGPTVCVQGFNACQDFSGIKGLACSCPAC